MALTRIGDKSSKPRVIEPDESGADFQVCCVAGFQTGRAQDSLCALIKSHPLCCRRPAGLEACDTAGLETYATMAASNL